jgi:hypothetical protein
VLRSEGVQTALTKRITGVEPSLGTARVGLESQLYSERTRKVILVKIKKVRKAEVAFADCLPREVER